MLDIYFFLFFFIEVYIFYLNYLLLFILFNCNLGTLCSFKNYLTIINGFILILREEKLCVFIRQQIDQYIICDIYRYYEELR